jgi:hypothetical protein
MKVTSLPPLRVSHALRRGAESVLDKGETLSAFVLDAVTRSIARRRTQREFLARGLASAARARDGGGYVSADAVLGKLSRRLASAKSKRNR